MKKELKILAQFSKKETFYRYNDIIYDNKYGIIACDSHRLAFIKPEYLDNSLINVTEFGLNMDGSKLRKGIISFIDKNEGLTKKYASTLDSLLDRDYLYNITIDVPVWFKKIQNTKDVVKVYVNFKTSEISLFQKSLYKDSSYTIVINAKLIAPLAGHELTLYMYDKNSAIKFTSEKINGLIMPMRF